MIETKANYLLSSKFESDADVVHYLAIEKDAVVKVELAAHLKYLVERGITGPNVLHYGGVVVGSTLAERRGVHNTGKEKFSISRAASSPTLKATFVHVRVAVATSATEALQIEAIMGQAFGLGRGAASEADRRFSRPARTSTLSSSVDSRSFWLIFGRIDSFRRALEEERKSRAVKQSIRRRRGGIGLNKGHMGPWRYGRGGDGKGCYALCLLLNWELGALTGREAVAYLGDPRRGDDLVLAAALREHLEVSWWADRLPEGQSALETSVETLQRILSAHGGERLGEIKAEVRARLLELHVRFFMSSSRGYSAYLVALSFAVLHATALATAAGESASVVAERADEVRDIFGVVAGYVDRELDADADAAATALRYRTVSGWVSLAASGLDSAYAAECERKRARRLDCKAKRKARAAVDAAVDDAATAFADAKAAYAVSAAESEARAERARALPTPVDAERDRSSAAAALAEADEALAKARAVRAAAADRDQRARAAACEVREVAAAAVEAAERQRRDAAAVERTQREHIAAAAEAEREAPAPKKPKAAPTVVHVPPPPPPPPPPTREERRAAVLALRAEKAAAAAAAPPPAAPPAAPPPAAPPKPKAAPKAKAAPSAAQIARAAAAARDAAKLKEEKQKLHAAKVLAKKALDDAAVNKADNWGVLNTAYNTAYDAHRAFIEREKLAKRAKA